MHLQTVGPVTERQAEGQLQDRETVTRQRDRQRDSYQYHGNCLLTESRSLPVQTGLQGQLCLQELEGREWEMEGVL